MESQLYHTHGRHYDEDTLTTGQHAGHDHNDDEHHGEKKSVIKKVKEKAKKIKNKITKHEHGHDHHHHDDDDDDDEETVEDPEVHGAPMYDSARVGEGGFDVQPRGNLERPSVMTEERYPQPVTNVSEVNDPEKWRGKLGQSVGMEEEPFAPNPTRMASPIDFTHHTHGRRHVPDTDINPDESQHLNPGGLRGKATRMVPDPHAPKDPLSLGSDPSNYGAKVDNPTQTGGKEAELSQLQHSLDKMGIESEPKTFDANQPENLPRDTLPSTQSSGYANKLSSTAATMADKATAAKDAIASKLGYSDQNPSTQSVSNKITGTLAPVYEKVVDAGSSVISKVTGQPQVHRGSETSTLEKEHVTDKGVSVKEHLVETLRPGEEDKALSDVIAHALHRGKQEKAGEDRPPMGTVTESVEVQRRLGTDQREEREGGSGNVVADKNMSERLRDAVGSWFGGKGDGTSYVTDEGLSSNPTGQNRGRER